MDLRDFTEEQLHRYARHIVMPEVGGAGQIRLLSSRVLVVGAGGLGAPLLMYLAAAGVGTLGVIDGDRVDLSNLQRQIIHTTERIGAWKTESARSTIAAINPGVEVRCHTERFDHANALAILADYDLVCDGSDNFPTRYLVNDACHFAAKPLVSAAMMRFDGQLTTFPAGGPCYRCLFPEAPPDGLVPSCSEAGILGAIAGVMGTLQAAEAIKELLEVGERLEGTLLIYDALATSFHRVAYERDPGCVLCGDAPGIIDLSSHATRSRP